MRTPKSPRAKVTANGTQQEAHSFWARLWDSPRWLSAAGVAAAGIIALQANVLVARHYERWDLTSHGAYTLSQPTRDLLAALDEPVEITVLLSRSDRLIVDTRHMLDAYRAAFADLRVRYVDPDLQPAQFLALQERHGVAAGTAQDGRLIVDASLIVSQGDRHWFIAADELVRMDDEGRMQPRLEAVLTEGIARVVAHEKNHVCFTEGHGEYSIDDAGPQGVAELRRRLQRSNFEVQTVPVGDTALSPSSRLFDGCDVVVVAGPERPWAAPAASALAGYLGSGGNVLILQNPIVDDKGRLQSSGLESVARLAKIELDAAFVIETEPGRRLPQGIGETFFASPKVHPITRGLALSEERIEARPLLIAAQPLGRSENSAAQVLLESSAGALAVEDLRPLEAAGVAPREPGQRSGPFALALAAELHPGEGEKRGPRIIVIGSANVAWSRNWRDPALFGTRQFAENSLAWLADRPALVSVPERPTFPVGLNLTGESLSEIQRYVLLYMPLTAALSGIFVLLRRRRVEQRSRAREAS